MTSAMQLLETLGALLQRVEYKVARLQAARPCISFEDQNILGVAVQFSSANELLENWEQEQDSFLQRNALALRRAGSKSWNVYSVFLAAEASQAEYLRGTLIEEDFRGSRKIVAMNLKTEADILRAVLPLLPIQNNVQARQENVRQLLLERLDLSLQAKESIAAGASATDLVKILSTFG
jgi:hypothetical protein